MTISNSIRKLLLTTIVSAMVVSCAGTGPGPADEATAGVDVQLLLEASPLANQSTDQLIAPLDMLEMSPEMIEFLDEHVNRKTNQDQQLAELIYAIVGSDRFLLAYDDSTSTAEGAFNNKRGNCLSFTNMFIAMARYLGLKAKYQEVAIPPDWSMNGQSYLFSQHVNVLVETRHSSLTTSRIVDFNAVQVSDLDATRVISDQRARAHYFSNIGVEYMLAGDTSRAFANFRASLREDDSFSSAWANLGNLYRREGYLDYADIAYNEALRNDDENLIAMSNLANLYLEQDKMVLADQYLAKVQSHRMKNPYYRYQLANTAFVDGDYQGAIDHLLYATRAKKNEEKFCELLSLSYLMSGNKDEAERWMRKAEERAVKHEDRQKYHHKLDLIMEKADS
jgi:Flp pilus assembly protein TadD